MRIIAGAVLGLVGIQVLRRLFFDFKPSRDSKRDNVVNYPTESTLVKKYEILRGKDGSYDRSWFSDENGNFKFPRYQSDDDSLVKIKDVTGYEEFWSGVEPQIQKRFTIEKLENEIYEGGLLILFEIDDFWEFMERLNRSDLKPQDIIHGNVEELLEVVDFSLSPKDEYLFPYEFSQLLYKNGLLSEYEFQSDDKRNKFINRYIKSLHVPELKELSKKRGLKVSLKKQELISQILEHKDFNDIPNPYITNHAFRDMVNHFLDLYLNTIKNQIDAFHPLYIAKVWEEVRESIEEYCQKFDNTLFQEIYSSRYWEDRIYKDAISVKEFMKKQYG